MKKNAVRLFLLLPGFLLQVAWYVGLFYFFRHYSWLFNIITSILSIVFLLYVSNKNDESNYKVLWLIILLLFPFFGCWLYIFYGDKNTVKPLAKKLEKTRSRMIFNNSSDIKLLKNLQKDDSRIFSLLNYISNKSKYPIKYNNNSTYYSSGEDMLKDMIVELKKAKKYIFIEYFIIENGEFFGSILEILENKIKKGVDVRIIYDDIGSINTINHKDVKYLRSKGIKVLPFNSIFFIKGCLNNRDHRKMMIIDGDVCFSGGVNIADEYINKKIRFGHWKDIGFRLKGEAVLNYLEMFMEFWNSFSEDKISNKLLDKNYIGFNKDAYVLSYYDSPINVQSTSNNLFMEMLSIAEEYAWFYTPYLLISDSLLNAFIRCAKRGVDVKIFVPYIPDKKLVNRMTKSYYSVLMDAGVKIYEYTPGFIHAKASIIDNKLCTIGTVNLDYRSLFLHFENNSVFYKGSIIKNVYNDFLNTESKSKRVKFKDLNRKFIHKLIDSILRIFAPLV